MTLVEIEQGRERKEGKGRGKGRAYTGREWSGKGMREAGWAAKMEESDGEEEVDEPESRGEIVNESSENQPRCMIILLLVSLLWICAGTRRTHGRGNI